jgi:hypothetical protein
VPPSADAYCAFSLPVVFVEIKNGNVCITFVNRKSTNPGIKEF